VTGEVRSSSRWWTLAAVSAATFMLMLDITVINVALPNVRASLHASFADLQWVLDAYSLTLAVFLLTAGSLADLWGRKRVFVIGFAAFTVASLAAGLAGNILTLNLARAAEGVGAAILYAVGPALIGHDFRGKERGLAFGVFGAIGGLAIAIGPLIGGALTESLGWRWIFLINVPIGIVSMALTQWRVRESRDQRGTRPDWSGLISSSVALTALVLALIRGGTDGWRSPFILGLFVVAASGFAVFLWIERAKRDRAMIDLSLFRNRTMSGISVVSLVGTGAVIPVIFLEISYVQNVRGFSPLMTGVRFLPLTLTLFVAGALAGSLIGRISPRVLLGTSLLLIGAGDFLFAMVGEHSGWTALIPGMVVLGAGMGMTNPPRAATAIAVVEPERAGMASGLNETFQNLGIAIGIAAGGALFQARVLATFAASSAGQHLGAASSAVGKSIAAGNLGAAGHPAARAVGAPVAAAAQHAFSVGLRDAILLSVVVAVAGAMAGFFAIRTRDLHSSALTGFPAEEEPASAPLADEPAPAPAAAAK
jgi:EmrB/QacA subfamily drug resistance transporter